MPTLSPTSIKELEEKLRTAVSDSLSLPPAERPAFIGRHLLAQLNGAALPASPPLDLPAAAVGLAEELPKLQAMLSNAVNAASASTDSAPQLKLVADILLAAATTAEPQAAAAAREEASNTQLQQLQAAAAAQEEAVKTQLQQAEDEALQAAADVSALIEEMTEDLHSRVLTDAHNQLQSLSRMDVGEVKMLKKMPRQLEQVLAAVCILLGIKPVKIRSADDPTRKMSSYTDPARKLMSDPHFLSRLMDFDETRVAPQTLDALGSYIDDEDFMPDNLMKSSRLGGALCTWVRSIHVCAQQARALQPQRERLAQMETCVAAKQARIDELRAELCAAELRAAELARPSSAIPAQATSGDAAVADAAGAEAAGADASGADAALLQARQQLEELQLRVQESLAMPSDALAAIAQQLEPTLDPTLTALLGPSQPSQLPRSAAAGTRESAGGLAPSEMELRALLETWAGWGQRRPLDVTAMPGIGMTVAGQTELHPFIGEERAKVESEAPPESGWCESLIEHARHTFARQLTQLGDLQRLRGLQDASALYGEMKRKSRRLRAKTDAAELCLSAWPRGVGPGELLLQPVGYAGEGGVTGPDATGPVAVEARGITVEWWLAAVNRAPFVTTRLFVECFAKPVTRGFGCALWFFVPPKYRGPPTVFLSHAWDGSLWDLRAPPSSAAVWVDVAAINQVPASSSQARPTADGEQPRSAAAALEDVARIGTAIATIGRTCVVVPGEAPLLPFGRSWCLYEIAHTPAERLEVRVGWGTWSAEAHREMRARVERLDVTQAVASSPDDKAMIDELVTQRLGSTQQASALLRRTIVSGFKAAATAALVGASADSSDGSATAQREAFDATGNQPLFDASVVAVWEHNAVVELS